MRIAQIAPLVERCPPHLYGGTERIVSYLTEELVRQGHEVSLFASGDSSTSARLIPCSPMALRFDPKVRDPIPYQIRQLEEVRRRAHAFDVLHFHIDQLHYPLLRAMGLDRCSVTTLHGRLDLPDLHVVYQAFADLPLVSISDAQRRPMPPVNWVGTVSHGLPTALLPFNGHPQGGYLAFLGRISPEKRPDLAIEIATRAGLPLKMSAKIDAVDRPYWEQQVKPRIAASSQVDFIGEIDEGAKANFLGNASALLFPVDWPEPFGVVMIEAMACGTPVIAFRRGAIPEVIENGVSGLIVDDVEQAVAAVARAVALDRAAVRRCFERRFTVEHMARRYVEIYRRLAGQPAQEPLPPTRAPLRMAAAAAAA